MKKVICFALFALLFAALVCFGVSAKEVGDVCVPCLGEAGAPTLDGNLDDEVWQTVPVTVIDDTNCNTSWSYRSLVNGSAEVKFLAAEDGLYVCAKVVDPTLVLSSGANDIHNYDSEYDHADDLYGYNGDLFILALDPLGVLEAGDSTRNNKAIWYTVTPFSDGNIRVFRSNPEYTDVSEAVPGAYTVNDAGWDFEIFISYEQIAADAALFDGVDTVTAADIAKEGARHTAMVLYLDRYMYGTFDYVRTAYGLLIDYDSQIKTYDKYNPELGDTFHPQIGTVYTVSRWGSTCDVIPRDNIAGNLGNGVAAKLHGIYLTMGQDHVCTPAENAETVPATCEIAGKSIKRCTICGKVLTYYQRGYGSNTGKWTVTRPASCLPGIEAKFCADCGLPIYQRAIPAVGKHSAGAPAVAGWVEARQTSGARELYCTKCNEHVDATGETLPKIFSDIKGDAWYANACAAVWNKNIMSGTALRFFSPDAKMTRGMFVLVLAKLGEVDLSVYAGKETGFTDAAKEAWYAPAVMWAAENGITGGVGGGLFAPNAEVTREQIAQCMYKFAVKTGGGVKHKNYSAAYGKTDISQYADASSVSEWAKPTLEWALSEHIISGTSATTLSPKMTATRAQVAQMVYVYMGK